MLKFALLACLVALALCQAPPFLERAPAAKQKEFGQLLEGLAANTDDQVDSEVKKWVAKQDASIQAAFAQFQKTVADEQAKGEQAHQAALAKFSPAAKDADAKLSAIANNKGLTVQQKGQQIDALLTSLPANVRQEIEAAMQG
ncbi:unnamed protein product [Auanema sp. JU1783]|nr:unnamed protein product [Auanema sp. JU1783]